MPLDFKAKLTLSVTNTKVGSELNTARDAFVYEKQYGFADGVGLNQADLLWHDQRSLGSTTAEDLDLTGVLSDVFGTAFDLVKVKGIFVTKVSGTGPITIFAQAANGVVGPVLVNADGNSFGEMFAQMDRSLAGWTVTAGTADLLQINNTGADSLTYDIFVVGTSA